MKLSLKLALYISILAIIGSAIVGSYSYTNIRERVDLSARNSVDSLITTIYNTAATSAYVGDEELAREVIRGLRNNSEILCVTIESKSMQMSDNIKCDNKEKIIRDLMSPWDDTEKLGELSVFIDQQHLDEVSAEQIYREVLNIIGIVIFISLAIAATTYFLITKPIELVSKKLEGIDFNGDVDILWEAYRKDEIGQILKVINTLLVNAKKQIIVEKQLSRKTQQLTNNFKMIFELSTNSLAVTDDQLRLKYYNPKFEQLVSFTQDITSLINTSGWVNCISNDSASVYDLILQTTEKNIPVTTEIEFSHNDGSQIVNRFFNLTFTKTEDSHDNTTILIFISDVTDQRRKLQESEYEASHDNLTKLLNRRAATKKIRYTLSERDFDDENLALLVIDLDGFKEVNDTLGHDAGDIVLRKISTRVSRILRKTDIVCRWGGDEFLIALPDITLATATATANKILEEIKKPIAINDINRSVGASIGLAITQDGMNDFSSLFDSADKAMYNVKKTGKSAVLVYSR